MIIEEDLSFVNVDKNCPIIIQSQSYNKFGQSKYVESFSTKTLKNAIKHCKNEISHNVSTFKWENAELIKNWVETHSLDEIEINSKVRNLNRFCWIRFKNFHSNSGCRRF